MLAKPLYHHTIIETQTDAGPTYFYKLGDEGPICLSGIRSAKRLVEGDTVAAVTSMKVFVGKKFKRLVAEWASSQTGRAA